MEKKILVQSQSNQNAINDILYVLRDRKMYINEKKLFINCRVNEHMRNSTLTGYSYTFL